MHGYQLRVSDYQPSSLDFTVMIKTLTPVTLFKSKRLLSLFGVFHASVPLTVSPYRLSAVQNTYSCPLTQSITLSIPILILLTHLDTLDICLFRLSTSILWSEHSGCALTLRKWSNECRLISLCTCS
jgi:hypothetical protein